MGNSLSNLVNNLSEGIHKTKFKYGHDNKKQNFEESNRNIETVFLNPQIPKMI